MHQVAFLRQPGQSASYCAMYAGLFKSRYGATSDIFDSRKAINGWS